MTLTTVAIDRPPSLISRLNSRWHKSALLALGVIVLGHWSEHVAQAVQIWILGYAKPKAHGLIGSMWPWLVTSEWLHFGFALVTLVGLTLLFSGFTGRAKVFWSIAVIIGVWHVFEHQLLLTQALTHHDWFGGKVPTSVLQAVWPGHRFELHFVYNTLVTIPMVIALYYHVSPPRRERNRAAMCSCQRSEGAQAEADDAQLQGAQFHDA